MNFQICNIFKAVRQTTKNNISNSYSSKVKPKFRPKSSPATLATNTKKESESTIKEKESLYQLDLKNGEIIYGVHPVLMALKSGKRQIKEIYYNKNANRVRKVVDLASIKNITLTSSSPKDLQTLARNSTIERNAHQGVCAYVEKVILKMVQSLDPRICYPL